jgi:hypothetical protein
VSVVFSHSLPLIRTSFYIQKDSRYFQENSHVIINCDVFIDSDVITVFHVITDDIKNYSDIIISPILMKITKSNVIFSFQGEWNGIVRKLIDKQADIGLGSMSVMAERETVIDFTVPYYDLVGITILMQLPSTPSSLFKFLTVLETNVWLCILAAYFFTR